MNQFKSAVNYTILLFLIISSHAQANDYLLQPGDVLNVSVWKEPDLLQTVIVRPDGKFSFPLTGDIMAAGRSVEAVRGDLIQAIESFIPEPVVTVQLQQIVGNRIYVLGKVQRPGMFLMTQDMDVMQALAEAGGTITFADEDSVSILRRDGGSQTAIPFNYSDIQYGEKPGTEYFTQTRRRHCGSVSSGLHEVACPLDRKLYCYIDTYFGYRCSFSRFLCRVSRRNTMCNLELRLKL